MHRFDTAAEIASQAAACGGALTFFAVVLVALGIVDFARRAK